MLTVNARADSPVIEAMDDERFVEVYGDVVRECLRLTNHDIAASVRLFDLWVALSSAQLEPR